MGSSMINPLETANKMLEKCKEIAAFKPADKINLMVKITAWYNMGLKKGIENEEKFDYNGEVFASKEVQEKLNKLKELIGEDNLQELFFLNGLNDGIITSRGHKK